MEVSTLSGLGWAAFETVCPHYHPPSPIFLPKLFWLYSRIHTLVLNFILRTLFNDLFSSMVLLFHFHQANVHGGSKWIAVVIIWNTLNNHIVLDDYFKLNGSLSMQGLGVVVRIAAKTTDSVYTFLQHQLASMEQLIGVPPYHWIWACRIFVLWSWNKKHVP